MELHEYNIDVDRQKREIELRAHLVAVSNPADAARFLVVFAEALPAMIDECVAKMAADDAARAMAADGRVQ